MNVVPGSGTRIAIDGTGRSPFGSHGGGISQPISRAGGATRPPHTSVAKSASQYDGLPSCTIEAKCWMREALTAVPANLGSLRTPTMRRASS